MGGTNRSGTIRALLVSRSGDLWFGGSAPDTLRCLHDETTTEVRLPSSIGYLDSLVEDAKGDLWVGSDKGGLVRIDGDRRVIDETARAGQLPIRCLHATADNSLWIGFRGAGLGRLKDGQLTTIATQQGLGEDTISQIIEDRRGWLWLGGDHGIFRVRMHELDDLTSGKVKRVQSFHYGADQALPRLHARWSASPGAVSSGDGRLWMPMETALAVGYPDRVREQPLAPPVQIQRVLVDEKPMASASAFVADGTNLNWPSTAGLSLPPDHHRLEIDFTALAFSSPESTRFRYRLDGLDKSWTEVSEPRTAIYPRLPAGNYRFQVIAGNADGIWNDEGATTSIVVAPFLWQRWWFQIASVVAFSAVLLLLCALRLIPTITAKAESARTTH